MPETLTPWGGSLTLTTANTPYQLSVLLADLPAATRPRLSDVPRVQWLTIQADANAGGARFYWGNSNLSATLRGAEWFATQAIPFGDQQGGNLIRLDHIWVMSDTAGVVINVSFLTR